ncbi:MAG: hypothetical protein HWD59_00310 [Coxiellaceae bacterium]|nr:MAG: hypothetical protein HWD59_00310 [Coxiellaceae bacterium]
MFFNYFRQQRRVSKLAKWQHKPVKQVVLDVADKTPKIQQWAAALVAKMRLQRSSASTVDVLCFTKMEL